MKNYDGGIGESSQHESHGKYAIEVVMSVQ